MAESRRAAKDFEDLHVFQEAHRLSKRIYELTSNGAITRDFGLVDQMRRASVSVMSNIAEGFDGQTNADFVRYLYFSKKSCAEVRAQAFVALDQGYWPKQTVQEIQTSYRRLGAGVANLIRYLVESAGPRKVK